MSVARVSLASPASAVAGGKTAKALRDGLGIETVDDARIVQVETQSKTMTPRTFLLSIMSA